MYLRAIQLGDTDRMYAMDVLCFAPPFRFSPAAMHRFARAENALVRIAAEPESATENREEAAVTERLLGFCIVHLQVLAASVTGYVVTLDVDPARRGQGIARRLIEEMHLAARAAGAEQMALHVFVRNAAAIRLYERLGYRCSGRVPDLYAPGLDAFYYQRPLRTSV